MGVYGPFLDNEPTAHPIPPPEPVAPPPADPQPAVSAELDGQIRAVADRCGDSDNADYLRHCAVVSGYRDSVARGEHPPPTEALQRAVSYLGQRETTVPTTDPTPGEAATESPSQPTMIIDEWSLSQKESDEAIDFHQTSLNRECSSVVPKKAEYCTDLNHSLGLALLARGRLELRLGHPQLAESYLRAIVESPNGREEIPFIAASAAADLASLYNEQAKKAFWVGNIDKAEGLAQKVLDLHVAYPMPPVAVEAHMILFAVMEARYVALLAQAMKVAPLGGIEGKVWSIGLTTEYAKMMIHLIEAELTDSEAAKQTFPEARKSLVSIKKEIDEYLALAPDHRHEFRPVRRQIDALIRFIDENP